MKHLLTILFSFIGVQAALAVPMELSHQGRLLDTNGAPADTTVDIMFTLYTQPEAPDSTLWTETISGVSVQDGLYNVVLGEVTPITSDILDYPEVWLGVKVGSNSEMTPRIRVVSVPYAIASDKVEVITPQNVKDAIQEWAVIPDADQDGHEKAELGGDDCDDWNPYIHPGAGDPCDGLDNDCDGIVDNEPGGAGCTVYYADVDGDGYGNALDSMCICSPTPPYTVSVDSALDCDDTNPFINPDATEECDGIDNNCDGLIDPPGTLPGATQYYEDADEDGYGTNTFALLCSPDYPYTATVNGDCNDNDPAINPGASEVCDANGVDENCNGEVNEAGALGCTIWYFDGDGDGWGDVNDSGICACDAPGPNYVTQQGDCVDSESSIYPGAPEYCNGLDDDCDGQPDNNVVDCGPGFICVGGTCVSAVSDEPAGDNSEN